MCIQTTTATRDSARQVETNTPPKPSDRKVLYSQTVANGSNIRSRFLATLGISAPKAHRCPYSPPLKSRRSVSVRHELLNDESDDDDSDTSSSSFSSLPRLPSMSRRAQAADEKPASAKPARKTVSFNTAVQVCEIPSRWDYSERMRNALWFNSEEMKLNYARNVIEFATEGWQWEQCLEEEQFVLTEYGLTHPVHLLREQNSRMTRHFCTVMSAQQQQQMVY